MRIWSIIVVFLFTIFLAAPTVVTLLNKKADVSLCFNFSEEEQVHKQIAFPTEFVLPSSQLISKDVKHCFPTGHPFRDSLSRTIFIPPPNSI